MIDVGESGDRRELLSFSYCHLQIPETICMAKRKLVDVQYTSSEEDDGVSLQKMEKSPTTQANKPKRKRATGRSGVSPIAGSLEAKALAEKSLAGYLAELDAGSELCPEDFEKAVQECMPNLLETRAEFLKKQAGVNHLGQENRSLTVMEAGALTRQLQTSQFSGTYPYRRPIPLSSSQTSSRVPNTSEAPASNLSPDNKAIIEALGSIHTTPYERSLASRISGYRSVRAENGYLHRDWESHAPWMDLMDDIHEHHSLTHPDREQTSRPAAPIDYLSLNAVHLPQVHDILSRTFWPGINVSDSLQYSPEKCTVVATYRHLVVGVALLSSPQETYMTYLAVRAGWENSQIATKMLYTLIMRNPRRDILLHVSADNPAMLLYNRFGFKAEEFIVGFYEDYLDRQSRSSKNAFRLRLRS